MRQIKISSQYLPLEKQFPVLQSCIFCSKWILNLVFLLIFNLTKYLKARKCYNIKYAAGKLLVVSSSDRYLFCCFTLRPWLCIRSGLRPVCWVINSIYWAFYLNSKDLPFFEIILREHCHATITYLTISVIENVCLPWIVFCWNKFISEIMNYINFAV